jgi:asparagine synthase (glutamine-hydrolysing)
MCRIAGVINKALPTAIISECVNNMCRELRYGGPDDEGIYKDEQHHLVLGHRRLSIIDTSVNGHQPMLYSGGRFVISYNGELYNYIELKEELKKAGSIFSTQTDTEVVLAAYALWGTAAFEKFSGMFAFAIWDTVKKEVVLARDPGGIKPLYYSVKNGGLTFASEVKALKHVPGLNEKNSNWQAYLMAYGHLPEPVTTLKDVLPLEKGTWLSYNVFDGSVKTQCFSQYSYIEKIDNREEAIQLIQQQLDASVKRHLISNAPIGVFLSGGLDSSIIAKLADRHVNGLNAISLYFDESSYSERKYQDLVKAGLSCHQHQHLLKEDEFHHCLPQIVNAMDLPCCDGINTWFISRYAKEAGLKAVLSGIGGDELFGGYPSFERISKALMLQKLPNALLRAGSTAASKQLRRLAYLSIDGPVGRYLFLRGQFIPVDIAKALGTDEAEIWKILRENPMLPSIDYLSPKNQASWLETNLYMQNQLLRDADVMSMAHGVEIRVPFLDVEFSRLSFKIHSDVKYAGTFGKQLLIDSFKNILPREIWDRPKMGFSFPFKEWFAHSKYKLAFNGADMSAAHAKFVSGQMHWSQFFTLLLIQGHPDAV